MCCSRGRFSNPNMEVVHMSWAVSDNSGLSLWSGRILKKAIRLFLTHEPLCDRIKLSLQVVIHEDHLGLRVFYETLD